MEDSNHRIELTFIDTGKTVEWTKEQCQEHFGVEEFDEILQGYAPHIVAIDLDIDF